MLKDRLDSTDIIKLDDIVRMTGYSKRQLIRWSNELKEKDIDKVKRHGNKGCKPINTVPDSEINNHQLQSSIS